ncbi:MAG: PQQ-binding-like beta-propeller repeat protein [Planctomycetales bacterium]|nr:PQQ-binding-like beta-propeller repeat protein [Planctomycetales bacterium]
MASMIRTLFTVVACQLLTASLLNAAPPTPPTSPTNWARFRGDGSASAAKANATAPERWSATENLIWKAELPGRGASSPVVFNQRVYVTSFTGYGLDPDQPGEKAQLELHVICFDLTTGKLVWRKTIGASENEQAATRRVVDHGFATNTVAVDETGVYAFFGVSGLVAYSLEGEERWRAPTGDKTAGFGSAASPILFENLVIVNCSIECGAVIAYEKSTGKEAYRIDGIQRSWTTPLIVARPDEPSELVLSHQMTVSGHNPRTGEQLWTCKGIQDYVVPCVVANDDVVYVIGGRKNQSLAIRLGGRGDVTKSHLLWETNIGANVTSPVVHEGFLYWVSDRGVACCLDAKTGAEIYRERLGFTKERIYASVVRVGEKLYLPTRDAGVLVYGTGNQFRQIAVNKIEGDESLYNATPAVSGDRLLLRTDRFLYCIGK